MCVIRVCGALLYDLLEFWYKGFTVYTAKFVFSLALLVGELSCGRRIFFDLTTFALIAGLKWHVCTGLWCVLHNIARMRKMPVDEDDLDWEEDEDASLMKLNPIRETLGHTKSGLWKTSTNRRKLFLVIWKILCRVPCQTVSIEKRKKNSAINSAFDSWMKAESGQNLWFLFVCLRVHYFFYQFWPLFNFWLLAWQTFGLLANSG